MNDHVPVVRGTRRPSAAGAALRAAASVPRPEVSEESRKRAERDEPPMARSRRGASAGRPQGGAR